MGPDRRIISCDATFARVFRERTGIDAFGADFLAFFDNVDRPAAMQDFERLKQQYAEMQQSIGHLQSMFAMLKVQPVIHVNTEVGNVGDKWRDGDKVGRDKTTNSDSALKIIAGAFAAMVIAVAWLFYYVATSVTQTKPEPPKIEQTGPAELP